MTERATLPTGTTGLVHHACGQVFELEAIIDRDDSTTAVDIPLHLRGKLDVAHLPPAFRWYNRRGVLLSWWHGDQHVKICPRCGQPLPLGCALLPEENPKATGGETGAPGGAA